MDAKSEPVPERLREEMLTKAGEVVTSVAMPSRFF
jgi:hypothetical protein